MTDSVQLFRDVVGPGAIVAGFTASFLAFRIQREADYYRQPWVDLSGDMPEGGTVDIKKTHLTFSMIMSVLAAALSLAFGVVVPLLGLSGASGALISAPAAVAGLISSVVALGGYFFLEVVHYGIILKQNHDTAMKKRHQRWYLLAFLVATIGCFVGILSLVG